MQQNLALNKRNAIAFYKTAYLGNPAEAVALYAGAHYIQHNPAVADGDQYVTMDFFRFDDNAKIVEHWDSIQEIPSETKNGNLMY